MRRPLLFSLALAGLLLGIALQACGDAEGEAEPAPRRYVGRAVCIRCHAEEGEAWQGSHHDLAMAEPTRKTVLGDFAAAPLAHHGEKTEFLAAEGAPRMRTRGPDGEVAEFEVAYTFGIAPLQQYLARLEGGRYQVLPGCWDARPESDGGQRWFALNAERELEPGHPLHWTGVDQNWNFMCADCHSTGLRKGYDLETSRYETTWSEIDVSCEACHGPGSEHVARAESGAQSAGGLAALRGLPDHAWILDEGSASARREGPPPAPDQVNSCAPCHSRRTKFREGEAPEASPLQSCRISLLEEGLYHADGQILDEVYVYGSFLQSKMHQKGVTCTDCHEPHAGRLRSEGNTLCYRCHRPEVFDVPEHHFHSAGSEAAQCVSCHMPERTYMEVDGRRDHSIRVPRPDLSESLGTPNACNGCHDDKSAAWAAAAIDRRRGKAWRKPHFGTALHAGRSGSRGAMRRLEELLRDTEQPAIARGTAARLLARRAGLRAPESLAAAARDPEELVRLGVALGLQELPPELRTEAGARLLSDSRRAVRIEAARALAATPADALSPASREARDRAIAESIEAQTFNADTALANLNLSSLHRDLGDLDAARRWIDRALQIEPDLVPAWVNLADLERERTGDAASRDILLQAAEKFPEEAAVLHALGLAQVRVGAPARALDSLERSAALSPETPRFAYVYAIALDSVGRRGDALLALEAARRRHPDDLELLYSLATLHRDAGKPRAALPHARHLQSLAPGDPRWAALVRELERAASHR